MPFLKDFHTMSSEKQWDLRAVIFDCDGTLVDSETLATALIVEMLAEQGVLYGQRAILDEFRGGKFADFVAAQRARHPLLDPVQFTLDFRRRSIVLLEQQVQEMPGALELVSTLNIEKSVASNGPRLKIETSLRKTGLLPYFNDRIISAYEIDSWKPAPQLVWQAARLMNTEPRHCLLVEDSVAGVEAGLAAGVRVIGFQLDAAARARFGDAVHNVERLAEIGALLARLAPGALH